MWSDEEIEWQQEDEFELSFSDRILGGEESDYSEDGFGGKDIIPLYYTILKYGIFTLYLILFVEFVRHSIDHVARGRPFFTAVLLMVYSELATLGIVEFSLFLWGKYGYIDKERKKKFADVHFALFLTAIFNALQYSLTSIVSTRLSNRLWVKTEQLELDHYVEIREEYERVQQIIDLQYTGCGKWVRNCILFVCRPGLRRRHESLRVQVRFHELRLHFIESNNLSFSLKVSDYLKRSELSLLIGLVHVSVAAWVLLISILNVGYFIVGMIGYTSSNPRSITALMTAFFFMVNVSFIVLSLALRWKMRRIFQTVMKTKVIETSNHEEGIKNQKQLFWFGSPPFVISMIQLMNFGYAVSMSIVIIYWEYLNETGVRAIIYLFMSVGCYIVFLYNLSALLPEYTLCTSLGYLTNRNELQETVAAHRLEEAERQRRKKIIENATVNDSTISQAYPVVKSNSVPQNTGGSSLPNIQPSASNHSIDVVLRDDKVKKAPLLVSDLVKIDTKALRRNLPEETRESLLHREERMRRRINRKKSVSDGVAAMRAWNQGNGTNVSQETRESTKRNMTRRSRVKRTTSQPGVIQSWRNVTLSEQQQNMSSLDEEDASKIGKVKYRKKSSSDSKSIQVWKESLLVEEGKTNTEGKTSSKEDGLMFRRQEVETNKDRKEDAALKWKKDRLNRLAARSRARKKSQSASAIIQSWQDHSIRDSSIENPGGGSDENYNSSDLRALSSDDGSDDNMLTSTLINHFNKDKVDNRTAFVKRQSNLRTLREIDDPQKVHARMGEATGATSDTKIILDLADAVIIDGGMECSDNDDNTIDTGKSVGNLSDINVIQAETVGMVSHYLESSRTVEVDESWFLVIIREVKLYFIGSIYPFVSHVVGTSIVFCFIGVRVEVMLTKASVGISIFWLEVIFLLWFIFADIIILVLFPISKWKTDTERLLGFATIIDILIVGAVLTLFFVAEGQRCCTKQNDANLSGSVPEVYDEIDEDYLFQTNCTCPSWGARTYGGLGMIEPFTSLILLRLFRFQFAHSLINIFNYKKDVDENTKDLKLSSESEHHASYFSNHDDNILHARHFGHENLSGLALELWERAIVKYPDIVQKYGQFSGALLQAMLGLEVSVETSDVPVSEKSEATKEKRKDFSKCENMKTHIKLAQSRYSNLPPRAQGIIIAGSIRKPVKPMDHGDFQKVNIGQESLRRTGLVDFEIDKERLDTEHNTSYKFVAPFARLVRSMRRCDRRHLPLLKEWMSVDVVMTQFEIVYFEAIDNSNSDLDEKTKLDCEACHLALKATKGGKNLRLCDVSLGRKVVGHLDFADVTEIHVAKDDVPISDMTLVEKAAALFDKEQDLDVEYWSNLYSENDANQKYARLIRWTLIQEERLKISTKSGTLYFRFYSDLAYLEAENSGQPPGNSQCITRDIAFQWAETTSRICGRSQLKQTLPHFGEENDAELRDYLQVVHFHEKEAMNEKKNGLRGMQNVGNVELLFVGAKETGLTKRKGRHERIKSMVEFPRTKINGCEVSSQKEKISTLTSKHRVVKSMAEFASVIQPQQNKKHNKDIDFVNESNIAGDQV